MDLNNPFVDNLINQALVEDLGEIGDTTTLAVVPETAQVQADFISREKACIAGLQMISLVADKFSGLKGYGDVKVTLHIADGDRVEKGACIATVDGSARTIISAERTILNFLQRLSAVATTARTYSEALGDSKIKLLDTRKTIPGYRFLEKYAVQCGGAVNHRHGLYDQVMIKDNHRAIAGMEGDGGIRRSIDAARLMYPDLKIEIEVDTLEQCREALEANADIILLDNMTNEILAEAAELRAELKAHSLLEASGGITLERLPSMKALDIDFISSGAITHSVQSIDIGLDIHI